MMRCSAYDVKHDVIHETGNRPTSHITTPAEQKKATATVKIHKKCCFGDVRVDRQTNRHAHHNISYGDPIFASLGQS